MKPLKSVKSLIPRKTFLKGPIFKNQADNIYRILKKFWLDCRNLSPGGGDWNVVSWGIQGLIWEFRFLLKLDLDWASLGPAEVSILQGPLGGVETTVLVLALLLIHSLQLLEPQVNSMTRLI